MSDVNSALSARFSTLPAAVKRARPSLPPPRGLISFFILSAIQLDFLRGQRGQVPFTKRDEPREERKHSEDAKCHDCCISFAKMLCDRFLT